jgi:NAD(P)-dependent dehydrogenase (short-subunit alcohol dehydrogenase family)
VLLFISSREAQEKYRKYRFFVAIVDHINLSFMAARLHDKVIIVTGGTGILGKAFNDALAVEGAKVVILGRNKDVAHERAAEITSNGGNAMAAVADVLDESSLREVCSDVLKKYGRIDGLVNAAGGNQAGAVVQPDADIFDVNMDALKQVIDLNLFGTILPTQVFGKAMLSSAGKGSIVNISSVSAYKALSKVMGYGIAKTAIEGYTKWFALELANRYKDAFRMNAIVPGFFLTEQNRTLLTNTDGTYTPRGEAAIRQTPYKRFGKPEELTGALVWLLSDDSSFVNGSSIIVDGGFLAFSGV